MKRLIKKGFTLMELMIVIAVIGLLSVVLIPKVLPLKNQAKNNAVQANIFIVRSFLENRAGTDRLNIVNDIKSNNVSVALSNVQNGIKTGIASAFTSNNTIKNPFSNSAIIDISSANVSLNSNTVNSSIVIGYDATSIPTNVSNITNAITTSGVTGVIVIIVYQTGYVVYGVDNLGALIQPTLVNMPNTVAQSPNPNGDIINPQVATPTFISTVNGASVSYTLNCITPNNTIRYTTDGTIPSLSSSKYTVPITVTTTTAINTYATCDEMSDSNVASITYSSQAVTPAPATTYGIIIPNYSVSTYVKLYDSNHTLIYEVNVLNGKFDAYGTLHNTSSILIYQGDFSEGIYNNYGTQYLSNGVMVYQGTTLKGVKSGYGSEQLSSGYKYIGWYKDGLKDGYGSMTDNNGKACILGTGRAINPMMVKS